MDPMRLKPARVATVLAAALAGLTFLAPVGPSTGAPADAVVTAVVPTGADQARTAADKERAVIRIVNRKRDAHGCNDLKMHRALRKAARRHSDKMADAGVLSHQLPGEPSVGTRITRAGYTGWTDIGENIGYGFETPSEVMAEWMTSGDHRRNILNCRFKHIGVGLEVRNGANWWTANFGRK